MTDDTWKHEAKRGVYRTIGFYRAALQRPEPLAENERAGLVDLLDSLEEFAQTTQITPIGVESGDGLSE